MGMAFMTAGFLLKQYEVCDKLNWKTALTSGTILLLASCFFPSSMVWNPNFTQFISLPLPAISAFVMFTYISAWIDRHPGLIKRTYTLHICIPPCSVQGCKRTQSMVLRLAMGSCWRTPRSHYSRKQLDLGHTLPCSRCNPSLALAEELSEVCSQNRFKSNVSHSLCHFWQQVLVALPRNRTSPVVRHTQEPIQGS